MAGLQQRGGSFRLIFRHNGKQFSLPIGKVSPEEAEAKAGQVDYLLLRIKQGLLTVPPGVDVTEFLMNDGKAPRGRPRPPPRRTSRSASSGSVTSRRRRGRRRRPPS